MSRGGCNYDYCRCCYDPYHAVSVLSTSRGGVQHSESGLYNRMKEKFQYSQRVVGGATPNIQGVIYDKFWFQYSQRVVGGCNCSARPTKSGRIKCFSTLNESWGGATKPPRLALRRKPTKFQYSQRVVGGCNSGQVARVAETSTRFSTLNESWVGATSPAPPGYADSERFQYSQRVVGRCNVIPASIMDYMGIGFSTLNESWVGATVFGEGSTFTGCDVSVLSTSRG